MSSYAYRCLRMTIGCLLTVPPFELAAVCQFLLGRTEIQPSQFQLCVFFLTFNNLNEPIAFYLPEGLCQSGSWPKHLK